MIGAGVLILPGITAALAGPASVLAWALVSLLGVPLALTFAALASRYPDAGGVATFTARAFGEIWGAATGWFYFVASATGLVLVPLTGAYYAASPLELGRSGTFLLAGAILAATVASNYGGLRVSGRVQLVLSGGVAVLLLAATLVSMPRISLENWTPFLPSGWISVGRACVLIFFAVFGWEAIAQLSAEFRDPSRDVPRSTLLSVGLITLLYVGVAAATVGTGTYGAPEVNRVAVARLLANGLGIGAGTVAASMAVLISLATTNAYVAATARLGYALARDGAFPSWLDHLDERGVPARAVFTVGSLAAFGMLLSYAVGWNPEDILIVPTSLGLATYIVGSAAGARLLAGGARLLAVISLLLCLVVFPFAGAFVSLPVAVGAAAWLFRRLREYSGRNRGS
ncbi:MAG: amino acid permease [Actinomycetota bacterium]|nr:amino acid permease [Actinomycetota bacterium]